MKKIQLEDDEIAALDGFVRQKGVAVATMKKIFDVAINDLGDIRNIDPKGNMGLQTLSRQEAVKMLEAVREVIFETPVPLSGGRPGKEKELPAGSYR